MRTKQSTWFILALAVAAVVPVSAQTPPAGDVVRLVTWQPKPGMEKDFEEGYKRHLEWHRKNHDTWTWMGWNVISGDRDGYFIDGSFFHEWKDFDAPVNPAGDGADNGINVMPYADVRNVAAYAVISGLSNMDSERLKSKLLTFYSFTVRPGYAGQFEAACMELVQRKSSQPFRMFLRPENGTTDYLLILTAEKQTEMPQQAEFVRQLLESIAAKSPGTNLVERVRTETARYRHDLSYGPDVAEAGK